MIHPAVEQIVYCNTVDGYAHLWNPDPEKIRASRGDMTLAAKGERQLSIKL